MEYKRKLLERVDEATFYKLMEAFQDTDRPTDMFEKTLRLLNDDKKSFRLFMNYVVKYMMEMRTCTICNNIVIDPISQCVLKCGHWCCSICLARHTSACSKKGKTPFCPMCRRSIKTKGIRKIY